jgi:hypothetical protein
MYRSRFIDLGTRWRWASSTGHFTPRERALGTHWMGWRAGLDDMEKWKFLNVPGLELRPLGRPVRNQSRYRGSYWPSSLYRCNSEAAYCKVSVSLLIKRTCKVSESLTHRLHNTTIRADEVTTTGNNCCVSSDNFCFHVRDAILFSCCHQV